MNRQKGQISPGGSIALIIGILILVWVYQFIQSVAAFFHLDFSSAKTLVIGFTIIVAANLFIFFQARHLISVVCPLSFPASFFAVQEALEYRANEGIPNLSAFNDMYTKWYGTGWGEFLIFIVLLGVSYMVHRYLADRY